MTLRRQSSGLNHLFNGPTGVSANDDADELADPLLKPRNETSGEVMKIIDSRPEQRPQVTQRYSFVSQPPPPVANMTMADDAVAEGVGPTKRRMKTPVECPYTDEEPSSSSMRTLKASFKGLHPFAQSCVARLMACADNSFEFNQLYQALLDTPYKHTNGGKTSFSSNILLLNGLSTLLDGKVISLPALVSGDPGQYKGVGAAGLSEWVIVHCTDESLDVNLPNVKIKRKGENSKSGKVFSVPLDVVLYYNKPY